MTKLSTNWKRLSRKSLVQNKYMDLYEDVVERPDGKTSLYYINKREPFSVIIPKVNDILYLVKQYRYAIGEITTEFPMGYVEGKNPIEAAITELHEEAGITAEKLTEIGHFWYGASRSNQLCYVYLAEGLQFGESDPEDGEFTEVVTYSIDEVKKMIQTGEIRESVTIVAFHYLEEYRNS